MILSRLLRNLSLKRLSPASIGGRDESPARQQPIGLADHAAEPVRFVVATRQTHQRFFTETATGQSLVLHGVPPRALRLFPENTVGLSTVYNIAIEESAADPAILVFIHDDLHLLNFDLADRVRAAVEQFQIAGVAGNKRRLAGQPGWAFVDDAFTFDDLKNLSGFVGHGTGFPPKNLSRYGPPGHAVKLLDGLMLIARSRMLIESGLRFDGRFDFHFYDMDFCREAEIRGISMGTCPISVVHRSAGTFGSETWRAARRRYIDKWKD